MVVQNSRVLPLGRAQPARRRAAFEIADEDAVGIRLHRPLQVAAQNGEGLIQRQPFVQRPVGRPFQMQRAVKHAH